MWAGSTPLAEKPGLSDDVKGLLYGTFAVVLFGLTLPASRWSVAYFDPVSVGFGRSAIASMVAAALLLLYRAQWPSRSQIKRLLLTSCGVVFGFPVLSAIAMKSVEASHGGVVMGILPLLTAICAAWIAKERCGLGFWLCSVSGALVVTLFMARDGIGALAAGDLVLVAAVVLAALGYALGGQLSREMPGWQVICWTLVLAAPVTWPTYLLLGVEPNTHSWIGWGSFLYLALVSQLFGFFLWNKGLALGGIAAVSQTQLLQPFITIAFAVTFMGEVLDQWTLACALTVVALVYWGRRFK